MMRRSPATANNKFMKVMNLYMPFMMFSFVVGTPLAMGLYFLVGQVFALLQSLITKRPAGGTF